MACDDIDPVSLMDALMPSSYKIMLLGDKAVGKSSIARRLKFDSFEQKYKETVGVEIYAIDITVGDRPVKVALWDTDGAFGDQVFDNVFIKGADAALIVSDIARGSTIAMMHQLGETFFERFPGAPVHGLLNKTDLPVQTHDVMAQKANPRFPIAPVSAKSGDGVHAALESTVRLLAQTDAVSV